ncbi:hypothetical protein QBC38DRAFT_391389 [Podospora fimiseda]|uniref:Uncharacterized protein n=1 Tax=Podospora fimiseda TaxID=252190 RepID=A0AAN7BQ00_9PEZI|nr:hypothetical protein QBC38DRAFT_391389 [Podospora fimiseda]
MNLPPEIRQQVFTQALRKPNIQHIFVKRQVDQLGNWWPTFHPISGKDGSGYRFVDPIGSVSDDGAVAARLVHSRPMGMPFATKKLHQAKMDTDNDLICFEFSRSWITGAFRNWNLELQLMSRGTLNSGSMISGRNEVFRYTKRIGVSWRRSHATCESVSAVPFPCHCLDPQTRRDHEFLKICPTEFAGFLDCFPALEEVYILLYPYAGYATTRDVNSAFSIYTKNFWTIPQNVRNERGYAMFHEAERTFIEMVDDLVLDPTAGYGTYSSGAAEWNLATHQWDRIGPRETVYPRKVLGEFLDAKKLIKILGNDMLRDRAFMTHEGLAAGLDLQYRQPREYRQAIKYRIVIPTDGSCQGWKPDESGYDYFRNFSKETQVYKMVTEETSSEVQAAAGLGP